MRVSLRHLAVFREVARRGGVNAAARAMYLSQPAASQAVAAIEGWFGAALFERLSSGMVLTAAGRACQARVERALEQLGAGAPEAPRGRAQPRELGRSCTVAQPRLSSDVRAPVRPSSSRFCLSWSHAPSRACALRNLRP